MSNSPRLHLVRGFVFEEDFSAEFAQFEREAEVLSSKVELDDRDVWALAQYVDLVGAGFGDVTSPLHQGAMSQLASYVALHRQRPLLRALCGGSAVLSDLAAQALAAETECDRTSSWFAALAA